MSWSLVKKDYEKQLTSLEDQKSKELKETYERIGSLQASLSDIADRNTNLRQKILNRKIFHSESVSKLNSEAKSLVEQLKYLENNYLETQKSAVEALETQIAQSKEQNDIQLNEIENEQASEIYDLENQIYFQENEINQLDIETQKLKGLLSCENTNIPSIQLSLKEAQQLWQQKENQLENLRAQREEAVRASKEISKDFSLLTYKYENFKSQNKQLKQKVSNLEQIVYGRKKTQF
mmetsp:Transcript_15700/g.22745  ORF Transcript_15700/g.22745 Transcript_15700/m.22745 type:complete len:236 (-) Transcript_15700:35-742(-)